MSSGRANGKCLAKGSLLMDSRRKRNPATRHATSPGHRADIVDVLARLLAGRPEVRPGKRFGFPAFYTGGRLFACVYGEGVGLKVPGELARKLGGTPGIIPFQPYGMATMKEWVQINRARAQDYAGDLKLFQASVDFVRGSASRGKRTPKAK